MSAPLSEREKVLTNVLRTTTEALQAVTAERDAEIERLTTTSDFDHSVLMDLISKYRAVNSESPAVEQDAWRAILAHVRPPYLAAGAQPTSTPILTAMCDREGGCDCGTPSVCCDHYVEPDEIAAGAQPALLSVQQKEQILEMVRGHPGGMRDAVFQAIDDALCLAAAAPVQADAPFAPDWVSYRQGKADGIAEAQERKPLTDEDVKLIACKLFAGCGPSDMRLARAIEAAHGIK